MALTAPHAHTAVGQTAGVPGIDYVGPLPGNLNKPCPSSVALLTISKQPAAAREMIKFMVSPEAAPLLRKTLVEPAQR